VPALVSVLIKQGYFYKKSKTETALQYLETKTMQADPGYLLAVECAPAGSRKEMCDHED
jgi:hypothetical protein